MKKAFLSLLGLTGVLALAGCGATEETIHVPGKPEVPVKIDAKSIDTDKERFILGPGESESILAYVTPLLATGEGLKFETGNPDVAYYDPEDMRIHAVNEGSTTLTVSSLSNEEVCKVIPVLVEPVIKDVKFNDPLNTAVSLTRKLKNYQDAKMQNYNKIIQKKTKGYYITLKNGELYRYTKMSNVFTVSVDDALFSLSQQFETKSLGDDYSNISKVEYTFVVYDDYTNAMFKRNDNVANRFQELKTGEYIGVYSRYEVLGKILGAFFTRGSSIMTDVVDEILNQSYLNGGDDFKEYRTNNSFTNKFYGTYEDEEKTYVDSLTYSSYREGSFGTVDADEESSFEVPAGSPIKGYEHLVHSWVDGYYAKELTDICYNFYVGDDIYSYIVYYEDTYNNSLSRVDYPNKEEYNRVYSISDL